MKNLNKLFLLAFFTLSFLVIQISCCQKETFRYRYTSFEFYHIDENFHKEVDTLAYSKLELVVKFDLQYSHQQYFTTSFIRSAYADGTICNKQLDYIMIDSIEQVTVLNLMDQNKDITKELVYTHDPNQQEDIETYLKNHYNNLQNVGFKFKQLYPEAKLYRLVLNIRTKSGEQLSDTTDAFFLTRSK